MAVLSARSALCARATARTAASLSRAFCTTPSNAQNIIPPQSPSYIRLPSPPQSEETKRSRVRGHLPVPRDIFPRREGRRKVEPDYIEKTAPLPQNPEVEDSSKPNKVREWKRRMAAQRRENLEESLQALWVRRQQSNRQHAQKVSANFNANKRAMRAPERADDRITRSTVLDAMLDTSVKPDPDRFRKAASSAAKVRAIQDAQREARRDALMDLYMKASDFIVNENDLKAEIEKNFSEDFFRKRALSGNLIGAADNVWDVEGLPTTVGEMAKDVMGTSKKPLEASVTEAERTALRTKRIAEEFTGGKIETPESNSN
ncbi:hypothetical protein NLU13_5481 [Sarocladium strictum]|uniref:Uncharacterized protein n=1 Tax=Sarocladium strictum TaxID=5046 RepID=A0AA39L7N7_SARSR|nr:hypothetical protein NLU13_5481 [Sarocladium strictum]